MTTDDDRTTGFSLRRWSRRKLEAARTDATAAPPAASAVAQPPHDAATAATAAPATTPAPAAAAAATPAAVPPDALPPVDTLAFDADFTAYLQPKVEESLKRQALKRMFQDPHFNIMDGLDTYIADYSIEDPIPPDMMERLLKNRYLFDPPKTRVNAEGYVEDVPPEEDVTPDDAAPNAEAGDSQLAADAEPALPDPLTVARPEDKETPAR